MLKHCAAPEIFFLILLIRVQVRWHISGHYMLEDNVTWQYISEAQREVYDALQVCYIILSK